VSALRTAILITHPQSPTGRRWAENVHITDGIGPSTAAEAIAIAVSATRDAGWRLVASSDELAKHGDAAAGVEAADTLPPRPDLCLVLGGDGSILYALRRFARAGVPVFGVNFGTVGFLAAVERDDAAEGIRRALAGETETIDLPGLEVEVGGQKHVALNDVTFVRRPHDRVAELSYKIAGEEVGHVRCDGLVAATPAGSTGYNLANQGPILAWGVEGYVVSYIAPHSLTARALVVAPGDVLHVGNAAGREPVDVAVDGEHVGELAPGAEFEVRFANGVGRLAQLPGASFYQRIREKFGHLAV
jgi:NAD+ kinase